MGNWFDEFNATFWLSLATMVLGSVAVCLRYSYQSKCEDITICGLIKIHRNVDAEVELDETKTTDETQV